MGDKAGTEIRYGKKNHIVSLSTQIRPEAPE